MLSGKWPQRAWYSEDAGPVHFALSCFFMLELPEFPGSFR